jgi:hypothetical protein
VVRRSILLVLLAATSACAIVPKNRRQYLADPTMQPSDSALEDKSRHKLHTSREGAAGGDGEPAGGGCGCGN